MKTLFVFHVDNVVDIITNSSSELFIIKGETQEIVEEMIAERHPNWEGEYSKPQLVDDMSDEDLEGVSYFLSEYEQHYQKDSNTGEIGYINYSCNTKNRKVVMKDGDLLGLSLEDAFKEHNQWIDLTQKARKLIGEDIKSKFKGSYFLLSKGDNPDWGFQQSLKMIGTRYHLG